MGRKSDKKHRKEGRGESQGGIASEINDNGSSIIGTPPSPTSTAMETSSRRKKRKLLVDDFDIQIETKRSKKSKNSAKSPGSRAASREPSKTPATPTRTPSRATSRARSATPGGTSRTGSHYTDKEKKALEKAVQAYISGEGMTKEEFTQRLWGPSRYKTFWDKVSGAVPERSVKSVYDFVRKAYPLYPKRPWTADDDLELKKLQTEHPNDWKKIGGLIERGYKECRDRWRNHVQYLGVKKPQRTAKKAGARTRAENWKEGDDDILIKAIQEAYRKTGQPELAANVFSKEDLPVTLQYLSDEVFGHLKTRQQISHRWNHIFNKHNGLPLLTPKLNRTIGMVDAGNPEEPPTNDSSPVKPKSKRKRKAIEPPPTTNDGSPVKPKPKRKRKSNKSKETIDDSDEEMAAEPDSTSTPAPKSQAAAPDEETPQGPQEGSKRPRKKKKKGESDVAEPSQSADRADIEDASEKTVDAQAMDTGVKETNIVDQSIADSHAADPQVTVEGTAKLRKKKKKKASGTAEDAQQAESAHIEEASVKKGDAEPSDVGTKGADTTDTHRVETNAAGSFQDPDEGTTKPRRKRNRRTSNAAQEDQPIQLTQSGRSTEKKVEAKSPDIAMTESDPEDSSSPAAAHTSSHQPTLSSRTIVDSIILPVAKRKSRTTTPAIQPEPHKEGEIINVWTEKKTGKYRRTMIRALQIGVYPEELDLTMLNDLLPGARTTFTRQEYLDKWAELEAGLTEEEWAEIGESQRWHEALEAQMATNMVIDGEEAEGVVDNEEEIYGEQEETEDQDNGMDVGEEEEEAKRVDNDTEDADLVETTDKKHAPYGSEAEIVTAPVKQIATPETEHGAPVTEQSDEGYWGEEPLNPVALIKQYLAIDVSDSPQKAHENAPPTKPTDGTESEHPDGHKLPRKLRRVAYNIASFNLIDMPNISDGGPSNLNWESILAQLPCAQKKGYSIEDCKAAFIRQAAKDAEPWSWIWLLHLIRPLTGLRAKDLDWVQITANSQEDAVFKDPETLQAVFRKMSKRVEGYRDMTVDQIAKKLFEIIKKKRREKEKESKL